MLIRSTTALTTTGLIDMPAQIVHLGSRAVGRDCPCIVCAEAGVNHDGEVDIAHRLVDVAADVGADAIKFQTFKSSALVAVTGRAHEVLDVAVGAVVVLYPGAVVGTAVAVAGIDAGTGQYDNIAVARSRGTRGYYAIRGGARAMCDDHWARSSASLFGGRDVRRTMRRVRALARFVRPVQRMSGSGLRLRLVYRHA